VDRRAARDTLDKMNALMMAAPWSQFLRRRTIDDIPDYIFGSAFLSVVVIGSIATMERRMNSRRRAFLEVEREEETLSPPFSVPAGASTHTHEETAISNETDEASHTFPVNIATTDSTGNNDTSRLNQWDLEHDRLLEISGAVEITIMNFPLRRGGETLSWFAMCDTITTVNADAVALGSECEGRLTQIADSCGYPFVDRKRNLMAKYPIFDSMGTIGTVHGLPTLDGNYAHVWIMVAPGRGIAMAILALSFDSNLGGSTSIGARHDLTSLASSGVPVFLCGQNSANCTPDRAGSALFLTSSDGKSLTSSLNGNGVIEGLPTCGHAHGSAVFRDSFTEAETRSSLGAPTFDPSSTLTGSPCILTAGPTQMLSCEYVEFDTIASRRSKSSSRNRSIGGKLATNVAREQGVPAGCGAVVSSFRVVPAVAPPMVAVEHSVVTEGQDFVVRPHDPSSSRSSSSSSGGEGNSNGWWIEVRVASRVSSGDNAIARSRASNNSSSSLNADSNSSNLWTAGHFSGSTGVRADLGGVGNGDASGSGAPGAYVGALLSWREAPGGRLCARFAGGQLGAGEYEAVLLDALTGADLATSRFQVQKDLDAAVHNACLFVLVLIKVSILFEHFTRFLYHATRVESIDLYACMPGAEQTRPAHARFTHRSTRAPRCSFPRCRSKCAGLATRLVRVIWPRRALRVRV